MKHKKGNISIVLLVALIAVLGGSVIVGIAIKSKYDSKTSYSRMENRYIAESGIDLSVGLFLNYLANQEYILTYTKNEDGSCSLIDRYSPYILDEIRENENADEIPLSAISAECNSYLSSIGYLDFSGNNGVEIILSTFYNKDNFKLSHLCISPNFILERTVTGNQGKSRINSLYLTVKSSYKGGEVMCNVEISDIYVVRESFFEIVTGETASITAHIDVTSCKVQYQNYQNYRRTSL